MTTIEEAKQFLRKNWEQGVKCPCCRQFVKLYKRKITGAMALALVVLYREHLKIGLDKFIHLAQVLQDAGFSYQITNTGDKAKLKYWGLIEPMQGVRPDGSTKVGKYRITQKGIDFATGKISIDEKIGLYNQNLYPLESTRQVFIKDVWENKFNYSELMSFEQAGLEL